MIPRPPRSTLDRSAAAPDVYKRQGHPHDVVAGALGESHVLGDGAHAVGVGDGRTAVLLDDQGHGRKRLATGASQSLGVTAMRRPRVVSCCVFRALPGGLRADALSSRHGLPAALPPLPAALPPQPAVCLLYTSPSPRDRTRSRMPSSA